MKRISLLALMFVFVLSLPCLAQEHPAFEGQEPFDQAELTRFINDWPQFAAWADAQGAQYGDDEGYEWGQEVTDKVDDMGWDPTRFFYIANQCASGISGMTLEERRPEMDAQMAEAMASIQNNPGLSPAQREQMLAMMGQSQANLDQAEEVDDNVSPQEMALIKANETEIRHAMGMDDQ